MISEKRMAGAMKALAENETDILILTPGSDLTYLSAYGGMADERFTALIVCRDAEPFFIAHPLYGTDAERTGVREVNIYGDREDPYDLLKEILAKKRIRMALKMR